MGEEGGECRGRVSVSRQQRNTPLRGTYRQGLAGRGGGPTGGGAASAGVGMAVPRST